MVTWNPVDLDLEVSTIAWGETLREVETWNRRRFPTSKVWVVLTPEEAVEALNHYGFRPLVRGLLQEGTGARYSMAIHLAPRRADSHGRLGDAIPVREERVALTISDREDLSVSFALAERVPLALERAAREPLRAARDAARSALRSLGVVVDD